MEELQEKVLHPEKKETLIITETRTPFSELDETVRLALACASEKKAVSTTALDLREIASFTEFFLITSGTNQLKKQLSTRPVRIEGYNTAEWILMDYGDFIVHIFEQKARDFYDLERLWRDARKVDLPADI
jgi:ribosome-associated protein